MPALAAWLVRQGVEVHWRTAVTGLEPGDVRTTRGTAAADATVVTVGHDVDRLLPDTADAAGLRRGRLRRFEVAPPGGHVIDPAVLPGTSMLRETARLLGVPSLTARRRWTGVYASAADDILIAAPHPTTRVVSVTSGIGMTTAFGLALPSSTT